MNPFLRLDCDDGIDWITTDEISSISLRIEAKEVHIRLRGAIGAKIMAVASSEEAFKLMVEQLQAQLDNTLANDND